MEREGGNVIKVNSVVLKENASELQHLERHLADILEETAQVERELGYRHSVFEEEIQALRKQRMKIVQEQEKTRMLSGKLQEIASLYEKTEQRIKTETGMNNNGGETNQGSDSMSDIYERNQPDAQNQVLDLWDKEFIRRLIEELQKKHWLFSYGLLPEFPPGFPKIHSFADVKFSKAWVSDRVANQQILKTLTTLMK